MESKHTVIYMGDLAKWNGRHRHTSPVSIVDLQHLAVGAYRSCWCGADEAEDGDGDGAELDCNLHGGRVCGK